MQRRDYDDAPALQREALLAERTAGMASAEKRAGAAEIELQGARVSGDEWSDDEEGRDEGRAAGRIIVQQPGGDVALAGELTQALGAGPPSLAGGVSALPAADFQPPTRRCESLEALLGERVGAG